MYPHPTHYKSTPQLLSQAFHHSFASIKMFLFIEFPAPKNKYTKYQLIKCFNVVLFYKHTYYSV